MAKANKHSYNAGIGIYPRTAEIVPDVESIDWQVLDNSNLNVINRVGIKRNKHVGCSSSKNIGHSLEVSDK